MKISIIKRYKPDLISFTAQRIFAKTIGSDLVPVQPLSPPKDTLMYMDFSSTNANTNLAASSNPTFIPCGIRKHIVDKFSEIFKKK